MKINVVLYQPEIPQNTGNIARTCAATGAMLHLIKPLGFDIDDRKMKRAGLDYWDKLNVMFYDDFDDFLEKNVDAECYFFTTKAKKNYTHVSYDNNVYLVFGPETRGLPESILLKYFDHCVRIPMLDELRSLNLSNSAAIAVYEVLRQNDFKSLKECSDYFTE